MHDNSGDGSLGKILQSNNTITPSIIHPSEDKRAVAWETATKPKDQGGLGIIDIKSQNNALLMKFLDNMVDIP